MSHFDISHSPALAPQPRVRISLRQAWMREKKPTVRLGMCHKTG